jgi:steroid 5-alpha reductase family enzyme
VTHHASPRQPPVVTQVLRKIIKNPIAWTAFHIGFISVYQNILLLIVVFPATQAAKGTPFALLPYDLPVTACFILFVLGETIADQQQWNFHKVETARNPQH